MNVRFGLLFFLIPLLIGSCTAIPQVRLKSGEFAMQINRPLYLIKSIDFSPGGRHIASGDSSGTISLWDVRECRKLWSVKGHGDEWVWSLVFTPDGKYIVSGGGDKAVKLWDAETGEFIRDFKGFNNVVTSVAVTSDGRYVLAGGVEGSLDGILRLWELESGKLVREYRGHLWIAFVGPAHVLSVDVSRDSRHIVSSDGQGNTILWDFNTGREIRRYAYEGSSMTIKGIFKVAFLPGGKQFISTRIERIATGVARLKDRESGETVRSFEGDIIKIILSSNGKLMLSGGPDGIIRLWDVETGKLVREYSGKSIFFRTAFSADTMAFSPDMKHFVSGSPDGSVRLWDTASGREIAMMAAFDDGEWLMITTDGYYSSSRRGHQYLNVLYGNTAYTAEQFYDVFYRPDIVKAVFRNEEISGLIALTMKDVIKTPPPAVNFTVLPTGSEEGAVKARVCYQVRNRGGGIGEVRLFHNGKLIHSDGYYLDLSRSSVQQKDLASMTGSAIYEDMRSLVIKGKAGGYRPATGPRGETVDECREIEAVAGDNELSLAAFNRDNTVQSLMKTEKFISRKIPGDPHLYILSIGIDRYGYDRAALKYAVKDARNIHDKLAAKSASLYKPGNIHPFLLTDEQATKENINGKISGIARVIKPDDGFILFAAGHGALIQGQFTMLTHDYNGAVDERAMISSNEIVDISKKVSALSQLFIFDTCHAGGVDYIVSGLYDARISVLAKKMGLHIYASAGSLQAAMDGYNGNGLFTYTLLDGLGNRADADRNRDGKISLVELGSFTKAATMEISKKIGHRQTPVIINFGRDYSLYKIE